MTTTSTWTSPPSDRTGSTTSLPSIPTVSLFLATHKSRGTLLPKRLTTAQGTTTRAPAGLPRACKVSTSSKEQRPWRSLKKTPLRKQKLAERLFPRFSQSLLTIFPLFRWHPSVLITTRALRGPTTLGLVTS
jgi:hypothetical protein